MKQVKLKQVKYHINVTQLLSGRARFKPRCIRQQNLYTLWSLVLHLNSPYTNVDSSVLSI